MSRLAAIPDTQAARPVVYARRGRRQQQACGSVAVLWVQLLLLAAEIPCWLMASMLIDTGPSRLLRRGPRPPPAGSRQAGSRCQCLKTQGPSPCPLFSLPWQVRGFLLLALGKLAVQSGSPLPPDAAALLDEVRSVLKVVAWLGGGAARCRAGAGAALLAASYCASILAGGHRQDGVELRQWTLEAPSACLAGCSRSNDVHQPRFAAGHRASEGLGPQQGACPRNTQQSCIADCPCLQATASEDVELQQRALEVQALLALPTASRQAALPYDAAAEDVGVGPELAFLVRDGMRLAQRHGPAQRRMLLACMCCGG